MTILGRDGGTALADQTGHERAAGPDRHRGRTGAAARVAAAVAGFALMLGGCGMLTEGGSVAPGGVSEPSVRPVRHVEDAPYVALGDSYTAGPAISHQDGKPSGCRRSSRNYPSVVAEQLGLSGSDAKDVSCSGETAAGLGSPQHVKGGTNPPQLDALSAKDRLVTIGIGGNDVGYFDVLETCAKLGVAAQAIGEAGPQSAPCRDHYGLDGLDARITEAGRTVAGVLAEIRRRAPRAKVLVVGYPAVFPASGGCDNLLLTEGDVAFLRGLEQRLDDELKTTAQAAGDTYVDTYTASQKHDACEPADARWVEPLLASGAAPLHPNADGEAAMADAVLAALRSAS